MTEKLKERFCKDYRIPIKLFEEPYFSDRLKLYNNEFYTLDLWNEFNKTLQSFDNEESYFAHYNSVKDNAIKFIKESPAFIEFNSMDMSKFAVDSRFIRLPHKDIYHNHNIGRTFISIDMKKANFSSLRHYNPDIFDNVETWEEFITKFTDVPNIIKSKYIRQIIFGQCNCKRHISYEKYLMNLFLSDLIDTGDVSIDDVMFFSNDEIVIDITSYTTTGRLDTLSKIKDDCTNIVDKFDTEYNVPYRINIFRLNGVYQDGKNIGYVRAMTDGSYDFKCLNHINLPWVLRTIKGEQITDSDLVFEYEGALAKFMNTPNIIIN